MDMLSDELMWPLHPGWAYVSALGVWAVSFLWLDWSQRRLGLADRRRPDRRAGRQDSGP